MFGCPRNRGNFNGPKDEKELDDAAKGFARCGYRVASMGFDIDSNGIPNRTLIGPPKWIEPIETSE